MTPKESAKVIFGVLHDDWFSWTPEVVEAFSMAISALEKQERDRWHSVAKEGNPKKSGLYIVTDNSKMDGNNPHTRYFNAYGDKAFWSGWKADEVVAWKERKGDECQDLTSK